MEIVVSTHSHTYALLHVLSHIPFPFKVTSVYLFKHTCSFAYIQYIQHDSHIASYMEKHYVCVYCTPLKTSLTQLCIRAYRTAYGFPTVMFSVYVALTYIHIRVKHAVKPGIYIRMKRCLPSSFVPSFNRLRAYNPHTHTYMLPVGLQFDPPLAQKKRKTTQKLLFEAKAYHQPPRI